jgi:molybdopterin-guanine dinucleotide biosynthesis protein A
MKQAKSSLLTPISDSRVGLISLEALQAATAQLQTPERVYRVTVVSCDTPSAEQDDLQTWAYSFAAAR